VQVIDPADPWRGRVEEELIAQQAALPFSSRMVVASLPEYSQAGFVAVLDRKGRCAGGFAVQSRPVRLPGGFYVARVEQVGAGIPPAADAHVAKALARWASQNRRMLRLSVDVFARDPQRRRSLGEALSAFGFRSTPVSGYAETLAIDLAPGEPELFASLHHSTRRKLRQLEKQPLVIKPIADPSLSDRMNNMLLETYARSGGSVQPRDWGARIELSLQHPEVSRIVGLFHADASGPEALLAYAWGCHGGDHVYYSEAASTRNTGDQRFALAYGVMWDLILWAKRTGASWFDMGGITRGSHTDEDPLGGISDFKRYFSQNLVEIREQWVLDDHSWQASLASAIRRGFRSR
jgi:hypothetical protein